MSARGGPMVWIDLEMSGLEPDRCEILEIATVVTDTNLEVLGEGPHLIVHQSDDALERMSEWCIQHHGQSGLTAAVRASKISLAEAERQTLEFVALHAAPGAAPLCGNSIDLDRRFLARHMPRLTAYLEDRLVDVSSVKELQRRWRPDLVAPKKKDTHRALDDILESIEELRFYRASFFRSPAEATR